MLLHEFKTPPATDKLEALISNFLEANQFDFGESKDWVVYVNDRLYTQWGKSIRGRSKVVLVSRKMDKPTLDIIFESKELIVLNKPETLPTQKTLKQVEDNLYDQVRKHYLLTKNFPQGLPYVGLHHRLDRMTSGLVLMTKQRSANKEISDLFKNKKIQKEYIAYCQWGKELPPQKWTEKNRVGRGKHKKHRFYFTVTKNGDEAITDFELMESCEGKWHKFKCRPRTGRTHQLRVQLAHKGYPIIGDWVYGEKLAHQRLMLHARKLEFQFKDQKLSVLAEPTWEEPSQT